MTEPRWRISSYSASNGSCVAVADLGEDVAIRNSNRPAAGTLTFPAAVMAAWVEGVKAGEYDDLGS